jgi:hypothetical protein
VKTLAGGAAGNSSGGAADDKKGNATAGADYTMGGKTHKKTLLCPRFEVQETQVITLLEERFSIETKAQRPFAGFCSTPHSTNNYRHVSTCYIERITTKRGTWKDWMP